MSDTPHALEGIRILDVSTLFAGPLAATILSDFGADVIKVEHPRGDPVRYHGHSKDGVPLWWKMLSRNKRTVTLSLSTAEGQDILCRLIEETDVLIENFRPGTLERWSLSPERLQAINPRLVIARVTGFGQFGPYSGRPGFGTLAESMSGFAQITGDPDGPPTLPPFGLADGITAQSTANAILMALYHRDVHGGTGQVLDVAIIEPILTILGPQPIVYDQLGIVQTRTGNRSVNNAPRNTYRTADGRWVAVSTSTQSIAERVMHLVGHPEVIDEPWFGSGAKRAEHADELDAFVATWIGDRGIDEVVVAFEEAQAAVAPIYDIRQIMEDHQYAALGSIVSVDDPDLGTVRMQNVMYRMSDTPGEIRWAGRGLGEDNVAVFGGELKMSDEELETLRQKGVI
jgi:crotonobetainyl-CoA:carnitine CoA-transferase CaiB-like acyl-CoA transferase